VRIAIVAIATLLCLGLLLPEPPALAGVNIGDAGQRSSIDPTDDCLLTGNGIDYDIWEIPDCLDSGGNHLNYDQSANDAATNPWTCGTSASSTVTILSGSATLDFADPGTNTCTVLTLTVNGAVDGDACVVGAPNGSQTTNFWWTCWISAADTASVKGCKNGNGAENPASGTFKVKVIQ